MRLLDGSMEVTSDRTMKIAVKNLCPIRCEVAATYLAVEQVPNLSPSVQVLRSYELPGTAVSKCHEILSGRLLNAMKEHHEANPNRKRIFNQRAACRPIEKRIPPARCQHPSETSNA